ncbi:MAG: processing protein [Clostridia bacterium]|jgi:DNA processing protein|nr:processing protein [Clostridia bacterium]MDN5322917.1 processing protein [Clostridia bacterium]
MRDVIYWSLVQKIWGYKGNKILSKILGKINGNDFWQMSPREIKKNFPEISQEMANELMLGRERINIRDEYMNIAKHNVEIITIYDNLYPKRLKNIYDPPPLLYVKGHLKEKNLAIAIVGARKASPYGKKVAFDLACQLSNQGVQIISGLARGIDACSHEGALQGIGGTIAVLGSSVDIVYPRENKRLFNQILNAGNSAVISEFPLGTQPLRFHFPMRNRIISGLADGIVVIEARENSGSLITTEFGLEQGKEIFAVPGPINTPLYKGSHRLIKDGAKLIDNVNDIFEEFGQLSLFKTRESNIEIKLTDTEYQILKNLGTHPSSIEDILINTKLSIKTVLSTLSVLEIKGLVKQVAGRKFISLN